MIPLENVLSDKTALFFIDEAKNIPSKDESGNNIKCTLLGLLCVRGDQFLGLEESFLKCRIKDRLWEEIHFVDASGSYIEKYAEALEQYISNSYVTFHSRMFANLDKKTRGSIHEGLVEYDDIYKEEAYRLIRSVIMKCVAHGMKNVYILADGYTKGRGDYKDIMKRLNDDGKISEINSENNLCCTIGNSCSCGALQICDLLVSTLGQYRFKTDGIKSGCTVFLDAIIRANGGANPMALNKYFPTLYSSKFHYYCARGYKGIGNIEHTS